MREITILNPAAGKGKAEGDNCYVTKDVGDCRRFVAQECEKDPHIHFNVFGGDGTLNEAVSGIMDAKAENSASVTAIPHGSGNDTVKTTDTYAPGTELAVDLITVGDRVYSINMLNIGFDCNVVERAGRYKRIHGVSGNFSYILGVIREFFSKFGVRFTIKAELEDGSLFEFDEDALLCAVANGQWCGGSFHNSPMSDMTDGTVEMILVRKMSRVNFIRMIGHYKKGTLISAEHGGVMPKYRDWVIFKRIKKMTISGCRQMCTDGEVFPCESAEIGIAPGAIKYVVGGAANVPETV